MKVPVLAREYPTPESAKAAFDYAWHKAPRGTDFAAYNFRPFGEQRYMVALVGYDAKPEYQIGGKDVKLSAEIEQAVIIRHAEHVVNREERPPTHYEKGMYLDRLGQSSPAD